MAAPAPDSVEHAADSAPAQQAQHQKHDSQSSAAIADHYDAVCRSDSRCTSAVLSSRQLNNWVKQMLVTCAVSALRRVHPERAAPLCVVDVACGRGGDIGKIHRAAQTCEVTLKTLAGVDVSPAAVQEAALRASKLLPASVARAYAVCDLATCDFASLLASHSKGRLAEHSCRLVWCAFALHYFFASPMHMDRVFDSIASVMAPGGLFVATYADGNLVVRLARDAVARQQLEPPPDAYLPVDALVSEGREDPWFEFESKLWRIRMPWRTLLEANRGECPYTLKYRFWMPARCADSSEYVVNGDAVEEYIVIDDVLIEQAGRRNLRLVFESRNDNILRHARHTRLGRSLLTAMSVPHTDGGSVMFGANDVEIASLYKTMAFSFMGKPGGGQHGASSTEIHSAQHPCDGLGVAMAFDLGIPDACALPYPVWKREHPKAPTDCT